MSIARTGLLTVFALIAVGLTRLVHGSLVSHATDRVTYGLVGSLIALSTVASLMLPGGLSSAMAKYVALERGAGRPAAARAVHRLLTRWSMASGPLLGLAAAGIAAVVWDLSRAEAFAVWLLTASYSIYSVDKSALYGFGRSGAYAILEVATSSLAILATVATVVFGGTAYLLPLAVGYAVFVLGARLLLRAAADEPGATAQADPAVRPVLVYAVVASVGTLAGQGFLQGTQLLAGWFARPEEVAWFAASVALVAPLYFLPRALGLALFPAMAAAYGAGDHEAVRRQGDVSTRALATLQAPVFAAAALLAPWLLVVFGGAEYAAGADVLRLMLAATWLGVLQVPSINALASDAGRRARIPAAAAVTGCLTGLLVVAVLGAPLGATGVALGYLAGSAVTAAIPMVVVWRAERMPWAGTLARSCAVLVTASLTATTVDAAGRSAWPVPLAVVAALLAAAVMIPDARALLRVLRPRTPSAAVRESR
ncbi:lipopolysaccharide biosynthesis protein [Actinoplanes philippinensis]|uniref:lipopolysaccharide biosynthesis protein n=1 Tax=Actinoplanes philippinensis TaxID=35752 RepID=UPI0033DEF1FE